jgi:uncharacterized OB-fold protein
VNCGGEAFAWTEVSGRGAIYTYTVARQTWVAGFAADLPYVIVVVELSEHPAVRLVTNLVGAYAIEELDLGVPVKAAFEKRGEATILQFELDRGEHV